MIKQGEFWIGWLRGVLIGVLIWCGVETALLIRSTRQSLTSTLSSVSDTAQRVNTFLTADRLRNFENNLNTTAITSQQVANNYGEVAKATVKLLDSVGQRLPKTLDKTDRLIEHVDTKALPDIVEEVHQTAAASRQTLQETENMLAEVKRILQSQELQKLIMMSADTATEVRLSAQEIRTALPELLQNLRALTQHSAGSTAEIEKFLGELNKPKTKKQKVWKALITAIAYGLPIYFSVR